MKKAKKINNKKGKKSFISTDNEMAKLIILIVAVGLAFAIFYIITMFVVKKEEAATPGDTDTEAVIQYDKILVSNILTQSPKEYYVLVYTNNDKYMDAYNNYLLMYEMNKEDAVPYYYVELDNTFNKEFKSEESKLDVTDSKDFKFKETTLLRIRNGKIVSTYEGKDNISGKLDRMTK